MRRFAPWSPRQWWYGHLPGTAMRGAAVNKSKRIAISLAAGVLAAALCMVYGSSIRSQAEQAQAETLAKYGGDRVEVCVAARYRCGRDPRRD